MLEIVLHVYHLHYKQVIHSIYLLSYTTLCLGVLARRSQVGLLQTAHYWANAVLSVGGMCAWVLG